MRGSLPSRRLGSAASDSEAEKRAPVAAAAPPSVAAAVVAVALTLGRMRRRHPWLHCAVTAAAGWMGGWVSGEWADSEKKSEEIVPANLAPRRKDAQLFNVTASTVK